MAIKVQAKTIGGVHIRLETDSITHTVQYISDHADQVASWRVEGTPEEEAEISKLLGWETPDAVSAAGG